MAFESKDWISVYAAIVSTIVGGWSIYREYQKRLGKIIFHYEKRDIEEGENKYKNYHFISIVNLSETTRFINKIQIESYYSDNSTGIYNDESNEYPIKLIQFEQYLYKIHAESVENATLLFHFGARKEKPETMKTTRLTQLKSRITIFETTGKSYQSKWLELKIKKTR